MRFFILMHNIRTCFEKVKQTKGGGETVKDSKKSTYTAVNYNINHIYMT